MGLIPLGGLATALGLGFQGYAQDDARRQQMARQAALDAQQSRVVNAQLDNYQAQADERRAATNATKIKGLANQRAYNALKSSDPTHPLAGLPYDETTDYTGELKSAQQSGLQRKSEAAKQRAYFQTLRAEFPTDALARQPFDETNPADYATALTIARGRLSQSQQPRNIDPLSDAGVAQRAKLAGLVAGMKPKVQTPDQIKSQTVADMANDAADILTQYNGGMEGGMQRGTAAALSHLPLVGNALEGKVDPLYQNAMNAARTLATQYLEVMPKSRFQPSTVDDILNQIAPTVGDSPQTRAAKLARVRTLKAAINKRAANPTDLSGPSFDDAPMPPGAGGGGEW